MTGGNRDRTRAVSPLCAAPDAVVARTLMAAAIAIATRLNMPSHEMLPMLQQAMQAAVVNRYG